MRSISFFLPLMTILSYGIDGIESSSSPLSSSSSFTNGISKSKSSTFGRCYHYAGFAAGSKKKNRQKQQQQSSGGGGFGKTLPQVSSKKVLTIRRPEEEKTSSYVVDTSDSIQELMQFLEDEECEGLEVTDVGISTTSNNNDGLRGIFAKEPIQKGEYICAIPFVSTLLINEEFIPEDEIDNGDNDINNNDSNNNNNNDIDNSNTMEDLLSSSDRVKNGKLFLDKFVNDPENSRFFKAYLNCLPKCSLEDPNFDPTPEFWSDEEIRQLEIPSLVQEMLQRKKELHQLAEEERRIIMDEKQKKMEQDKHDNVDVDVDVDAFILTVKHAAWIVRSRAFTTLKKAMTLDGTMGLIQRTVLIPFFDFLNHYDETSGCPCNAEMEVIETKEYDESFYAVIAKEYIPKGQEIRIMYGTGEETSVDLFAKYGFLPGGNTVNDQNGLLLKRDGALQNVKWSTTLEEDINTLETSSSDLSRAMKTILNLRIYMKKLQNDYNQK